MYINKVLNAGEYALICNYTPKGFGAPGRKREKRIRETPKAMEKYNRHKRAEKLQLLMLMNFDKGYHITLDYPKGQRPQTYEEAEKILQKFLYKVSRKLKKENRLFKYIAITERGKRQKALHHHMIMESDPFILKMITEIWGNHIKISQMYEEGAYKDLADYFCKIETKEEQTKGKSKYHRSRNLKEPTVRARIVAGALKDDPVVPDGYELVTDSVVNGVNEIVGIKYQRYLIRRVKKERKSDAKGIQKCNLWESIKSIFKKRKKNE